MLAPTDQTPEKALARLRPNVAWQRYSPTANSPWDAQKVGHLYRRAAGGASLSQIRAAVDQTPDEVLDRLLVGGEDLPKFEEQAGRLKRSVLTTNSPEQFKAFWLYRMLHSPHPLQERMTLFWHNLFATSNAKVNDLVLMQQQNETIRQHALGHFDDLLQAMTRDPAMLIWLDSQANVKGQPNENYAREVFELFSLGTGNYTEKDIQEAARALTGWRVTDRKATLLPDKHDYAPKTIFGQTGNWTSGDVVRLATAQPGCAEFLVRKLYRFFVSETLVPGPEYFTPLAEGFRVRNYDISWCVRQILSSWMFYSPVAYGQKVKSPVDFVIGTVRSLGGAVSTTKLAQVCDQLGQSLFYPPSVKGWDGGTTWISSTALLHRQNLVFELTRGQNLGARCDPAHSVDLTQPIDEVQLVRTFLELFQPVVNTEQVVEQVSGYLKEERKTLEQQFQSTRSLHSQLARAAAHLILTLPEYQIA